MHSASTTALRPGRPSLFDHLAHSTLLRAFASLAPRKIPLLCIDATAGNGHDSLFLVSHAPQDSLVLCFDVQKQAVATTEARLQAARQEARIQGQPLPARWRCFQMGHEQAHTVIATLPYPDQQRALAAAIFNFGWLPGSDKSIITQAESSCIAVSHLLSLLHPCGCLCLHCYTGHEGGKEEEEALRSIVAALPPRHWRVLIAEDGNRGTAARKGGESLILVERLEQRKK